jgi:nitronate monooxygenase
MRRDAELRAGNGAIIRARLAGCLILQSRMPVLAQLELPIVQAPLAGGPSTPALAAAVSEAGGLGFLAAGYKGVDAVRADLDALRALTARPFGLNLFVPPTTPADPAAVSAYAEALQAESERRGVALGEPRRDDDSWEEKLALALEERVPVVSFVFGLPSPDVIGRFHDIGSEVWVTVTTPAEARLARDAGARALVVQGAEAGGHRGGFEDEPGSELGLLAALQLVGAAVELPLVATGGLSTGRSIAAVLAAGAAAAQLGTALMRTPEAGTSPAHRDALASAEPTALTRAFTGRTARGVANRFLREHSGDAPAAYPEVHHLTAPLRTAAREQGDADGFHLWAGQAHALAEELPAGELVRRLADDASAALADAARRVGSPPSRA